MFNKPLFKVKKTTYKFSALSLALFLGACGGGGSSTPSVSTGASNTVAATSPIANTTPTTITATGAINATQTQSVTSTSTASSIVTSVPAPSYLAGSEELAAFNLLNAERSSCGFGLLAQNVKLDAVAKGHADWMLINNYRGHYQTAAAPSGFTGATIQDRLNAALYSYFDFTETVLTTLDANITGEGVASARNLLSAPYHLFGMIAPYSEVGIAVRSSNSVAQVIASSSRRTVYDFGVPAGSTYQTVDSNTVVTYPCQGTTGTNYQLRAESPNPVPGRDLAVNPIGHPVLVMVRKGQVLTITGATMTSVVTGVPVALRAPITAANDPNNVFQGYGTYMGYVAPDAPLAPNTAYAVTVRGTNDGVVFTKSFTFTTGAGG